MRSTLGASWSSHFSVTCREPTAKVDIGRRAGDRLGDALQRLQQAAAPLLLLLHPTMRESIDGIGRAVEE
jgi:hypothetical protein